MAFPLFFNFSVYFTISPTCTLPSFFNSVPPTLAFKSAVISASVGTYTVPANSDLTLEQAVENVDNIMYEQKQAFHKEDDKKKTEAAEKPAEEKTASAE